MYSMHMSPILNSIPSTAPQAPQFDADSDRQRAVFRDFVAGTFYQELLKSMRDTHGEAAYFHGGRAEEIFRGQMDQHIVESLAENHGDVLAEPFYDAWTLGRR